MKSKNPSKSQKNYSIIKQKNPSKKQSFMNNKVNKIIPKRYETTIKVNSKKLSTKSKPKQKLFQKSTKQMNNEDSSTNCLSGSNNKKINLEINCLNLNFNNIKNKEELIIPSLLLNSNRESETESYFINFKLGEKDSFMDSLFTKTDKKIEKEKMSKKINLKNNNINPKYNYCKVNKDCGKNENDSLEIYDFNDETNVDYVLKNMSALSCNKTNRNESSVIFENCDEKIGSKAQNENIINSIKIFEINDNMMNLGEKNK